MGFLKSFRFAGALLAAFTLQQELLAQLPVPTGLQPGDTYHLIFNSSTFTNALSSDINVYNDFVQAAADAAGIGASEGVTWKAVASTASIDARVNASVGLSTPVYNTRAAGLEKVADGFVDLWDTTIDNFPKYDEFGNENPIDAWTGSNAVGLRAAGSTLGDPSGTAWCGRPTLLNSQWLSILQPNTLTQLPLYALSEALTVPEIDADFDTDFDIDGTDFLLWQRGNGDSDGNGTTDSVDLANWQSQYQAGSLSASQAALSTVSVPEPTGLLLLTLALVTVVVRRSAA